MNDKLKHFIAGVVIASVVLVCLAFTQDTTIYKDVLVYPNPAHDHFYLRADTLPGRVEIYDMSGRLMQSEKIDEGQTEVRIDVSLKKGVYILVFKEK